MTAIIFARGYVPSCATTSRSLNAGLHKISILVSGLAFSIWHDILASICDANSDVSKDLLFLILQCIECISNYGGLGCKFKKCLAFNKDNESLVFLLFRLSSSMRNAPSLSFLTFMELELPRLEFLCILFEVQDLYMYASCIGTYDSAHHVCSRSQMD
jgi:hypothetical protein